MKILLLGAGGREHTLAWKMAQSPLCNELYIAPGNGGTDACGTNVNIAVTDFEALGAFCFENGVDLVVVGPEDPLVKGVYDYFTTHDQLKHIPVIGPSKEGATLEGSKAYAKEFMAEFNIPTAAYREFNADNIAEGKAFIDSMTPPIVLKADGLAAGKGVLIINDKEEAKASLEEMILEAKFGEAGSRVVIEEFLDGIEFSVFALTDGTHYKILPVAKDYKRIGEGDTGLNTGGMGAISPPPFVDEALMDKVIDQVVEPTVKGLAKRNIVYKGFIYFGLIKVEGEPKVIEYNVRMGDPETEVVIPRIESDLVELFMATASGTLDQIALKINPQSCATIMLVSGGYPEAYEKGKTITGIDEVEGSLVFHAGTKKDNAQLLTNGGRVIAITSFGNTLEEALAQSKNNAGVIDFAGKYYRQDIGFDVVGVKSC